MLLHIRHPGERFVQRAEQEWPLARTEWVKTYLDITDHGLTLDVPDPASEAYRALGKGSPSSPRRQSEPWRSPGPWQPSSGSPRTPRTPTYSWWSACSIPREREVLFIGASEPRQPISQGWLRASHRALDPDKSLPWRPYHLHSAPEPLSPDEVYELDVEIWPTCIVVPAGYRLGVSVLGRDYEHGFPWDPDRIRSGDAPAQASTFIRTR